MTYEIRAIFEKGLLRPLDPLALGENDGVTVIVRAEDSSRSLSTEIAAQKKGTPSGI